MSWNRVFSANGYPSLEGARGSWVMFVTSEEIERVWQHIREMTQTGELVGYMASRSTGPMVGGGHEGRHTICCFCMNRDKAELKTQLVAFGYQEFIIDFRPIRSQRIEEVEGERFSFENRALSSGRTFAGTEE